MPNKTSSARRYFSDFPDVQSAYDKFLAEGPFTVALATSADATAFRHRCHRFRRLYSAWCDETGAENPYALILIRQRAEILQFDRRPNPVQFKLPEPEATTRSELEALADNLLSGDLFDDE